MPSLHGGLDWEKDRLKVLGVFLDTEDFQTKNREWRRKRGPRRCLNENGCFPQLSRRDKRSGLGTTKKQSAIWLWLKEDRDSLTFLLK